MYLFIWLHRVLAASRGTFYHGSEALECAGSVVVAHGLNYSATCGILVPWLGIEPVSPALRGGFLTTEVPRLILSRCFFLFSPPPFHHLPLFSSCFHLASWWSHSRTMKAFPVGSENPSPGGMLGISGTQLLSPWVSWLGSDGCFLLLVHVHSWQPCLSVAPNLPSLTVCYMENGILFFLLWLCLLSFSLHGLCVFLCLLCLFGMTWKMNFVPSILFRAVNISFYCKPLKMGN